MTYRHCCKWVWLYTVIGGQPACLDCERCAVKYSSSKTTTVAELADEGATWKQLPPEHLFPRHLSCLESEPHLIFRLRDGWLRERGICRGSAIAGVMHLGTRAAGLFRLFACATRKGQPPVYFRCCHSVEGWRKQENRIRTGKTKQEWKRENSTGAHRMNAEQHLVNESSPIQCRAEMCAVLLWGLCWL